MTVLAVLVADLAAAVRMHAWDVFLDERAQLDPNCVLCAAAIATDETPTPDLQEAVAHG